MYLRSDLGEELGGGATAALLRTPARARKGCAARLAERFPDFELVPDLGSRIGTFTWYRGAATCVGLCALTLLLEPSITVRASAVPVSPLSVSDNPLGAVDSVIRTVRGSSRSARIGDVVPVESVAVRCSSRYDGYE